MTGICIRLSMCGPLSDAAKEIEQKYDHAPSVKEIKERLAEELQEKGEQYKEIVAVSALGDDERVYYDAEIIENDTSLSVLPPVSGG